MNCRRFEQDLEEYVEGTLSPQDSAAAGRHLADCIACRQALRHRRELGESLSARLRELTQSLQPDPGLAERLLREWERRARVESAPRERLSGRNVLANVWPWAVAASVLVGGVIGVGHFSALHSTSPETAHSANPTAQDSVFVQGAYPMLTHTFRWDGAVVTDSLTAQTVVVDGTLSPADKDKSM